MRNIKLGDRFYSYYFKKECIVTKVKENKWYFKVELPLGFLSPEIRARCDLSEVRWL